LPPRVSALTDAVLEPGVAAKAFNRDVIGATAASRAARDPCARICLISIRLKGLSEEALDHLAIAGAR